MILISLSAYADDCAVTSSADSGAGTLRNAALKCGGEITFGVDGVKVTSKIFFAKNGASIDGDLGNDVVASVTTNGFAGPLFEILTTKIAIKNISLDHADVCIKTIKGSGSFENITFNNCSKGVLVSGASAISNKISQIDFVGVSTPISVEDGANQGILPASNVVASWMDIHKWGLYGTDASDDVANVEFYVDDGALLLYHQTILADGDDFDLNSPDFTADVTWQTLSPSNVYRLVFIDQYKNTSMMSDAIDPVSYLLGELPPEMAGCADSDWFWADGMDGGSDDDGLANSAEDANTNCIVDDGETSPVLADTDGDAADDDVDNCPTTPNADQADEDNDSKGDACKGEENDGGDNPGGPDPDGSPNPGGGPNPGDGGGGGGENPGAPEEPPAEQISEVEGDDGGDDGYSSSGGGCSISAGSTCNPASASFAMIALLIIIAIRRTSCLFH